MNINVNLTDHPLVSLPGEAVYPQINTSYDTYNDKRRYKVYLKFNKENESKMKKICDDFLEAAKANAKFEGKKWSGDATTGYKEQEDGTLLFNFQTAAFYTDRQTGEEKQKFIPVLDTVHGCPLDKDVAIGEGSVVRVLYQPSAYWSSTRANGVNLYIMQLAVDKLVRYNGGGIDYDAFGVTPQAEENPFDGDSDEEIPV